MIGIAGQVVEGQDCNRWDVWKLERILGLVGRGEVWLEHKPVHPYGNYHCNQRGHGYVLGPWRSLLNLLGL